MSSSESTKPISTENIKKEAATESSPIVTDSFTLTTAAPSSIGSTTSLTTSSQSITTQSTVNVTASLTTTSITQPSTTAIVSKVITNSVVLATIPNQTTPSNTISNVSISNVSTNVSNSANAPVSTLITRPAVAPTTPAQTTNTVPNAANLLIKTEPNLTPATNIIKSNLNNQATNNQPINSSNASIGGTPSASSTAVNNVSSITATVQHSTPAKTNGETSSTADVNDKPSDSVVVLNKQRLQELVAEIDSNEQLDDDVEEILLNIADDFIDNLVSTACLLAKHRGSKNLETKDVQLILEKNYNLYIPGFTSLPLDESFKNVYKKSPATESHKQRMALIKKTLKKF